MLLPSGGDYFCLIKVPENGYADKNNMKTENARGIQRQMMARDLVSSLAL